MDLVCDEELKWGDLVSCGPNGIAKKATPGDWVIGEVAIDLRTSRMIKCVELYDVPYVLSGVKIVDDILANVYKNWSVMDG